MISLSCERMTSELAGLGLDRVPGKVRSSPLALLREPEAIFSPHEMEDIFKRIKFAPRQKEIVQLLLMGMSDRQISAKLNIGEHTVRVHLRRIFSQHKVSSRTQLVLLIFRVYRHGCRQAKNPSRVEGKDGGRHSRPEFFRLEKAGVSSEDRVRNLLEEIWPVFEPILPPTEWHGRGRLPASNRECFYALLHVVMEDLGWEQLPAYFPRYHTVLERRKRWLELESFHAAWKQIIQKYDPQHRINWARLNLKMFGKPTPAPSTMSSSP